MKSVKTYNDLQSAICDLENMAHVAAQYLEGHLRRQDGRFILHQQDGEAVTFCAYKLEAMAADLKKVFYKVESG